LRAFLRRLRRREKNEAVREAIEELIEETPESDTPISDDQRELLANILKLRDKTVRDVMVPRVDIVGIAADTPLDAVVRLIQAEAHSRYPVYRETLDDVIGMIHIKDVLAYWGTAKKFNLRDILRRVVFVAPTFTKSTCCSNAALAHAHGAGRRRIWRHRCRQSSRIWSKRS
jgi:CBS domain containing-hemolysin-like protein